jgi:GNAT superfamily N-acetyltransferase
MTPSESFALRRLEARDVAGCERVLRALPHWFGIEEANRAYLESLRRLPGAVVEADGEIVGFVALEEHDPKSLEIHVMGVEPGRHRRGIGRELVRWSRDFAAARGGRWLHVKTRGPATPDPGYEKTRSFYLAQGFEPLFESLALWGPENSALILVMRV